MTERPQCQCAVLLFPLPVAPGVRRDAGNAVDLDSGLHGYTHMAVEVTDDNGRQIAIEANLERPPGVKTTDLDDWTHPKTEPGESRKYAQPYGRIPVSDLQRLNVTCPEFCQRAKQMLGTPYSPQRVKLLMPLFYETLVEKAREKGILLAEEGVVCTDVVTGALGERATKTILDWLHKQGLFWPPAAAGIGTDGVPFGSPNALASALGLRHAQNISQPAERLYPEKR